MDNETIVISVSGHEERLNNLEAYQKKQNGSLQRIEKKIDNLIWWMMISFAGIVSALLIGLLVSK